MPMFELDARALILGGRARCVVGVCGVREKAPPTLWHVGGSEDYEEIAVRIARSNETLTRLKDSIRASRESSTLFDTVGWMPRCGVSLHAPVLA